ncbi:hypothetical protein C5167_031698 [Papaver somniferum]|uniref:RNase H type-1 domain-containing protein n=1 Tax=Papaver somniferum TaxID=3469 RepID=A0A4Y7K7T1_PAPSO|nr:hypothetical protein C5167_031698 [Papaver somniferum]
MGEVLPIQPADAVPEEGVPVKAHAKPHYFGEMKEGERKEIVVSRAGDQVPNFEKDLVRGREMRFQIYMFWNMLIMVVANKTSHVVTEKDIQKGNTRETQDFGKLSGQMLNFDKSCVYFSNNLDPVYCDTLASALSMSIVTDSDKYLGDPLLLGHSKVQRWKPPDNGFLKVNVDASFYRNNSQGGIVLIISDFAGNCIGVQGKYFDGGMREGIEVEELECRAMFAAIKFAINKNFRTVIFESDSVVVIKSINEQKSHVHWLNQHFILDIKFLLGKLEVWKCISVKKDANGVADKLAKKARTMKLNLEFHIDLPPDIKEWVTN